MFNINGENWRVLIVSPMDPSLIGPSGRRTLGVCDDLSKTICIADGLAQKKMFKVLCHEITHAAMFSYNVVLSYAQEELLADLLATYGAEIIETANLIFHRIIENREFI